MNPLKIHLSVFILMFSLNNGLAQYFDSTTINEAQAYTEKVKKELGPGTSKQLRSESVRFLSGTMGRLDRMTLLPKDFAEHIQLAEISRARFYNKIAEKDFEDYILAFRIRCELSTKAGWRGILAKKLETVIADEKDPVAAATKIFEWMSDKVRITGNPRAYALTIKGDLDPLSTLRGGYGREIDAAILAVACLRSCGIASRLVYAPVLANEEGGKVWVEYRGKVAWIAWVPSLTLATDEPGLALPRVPLSGHRDWLKKEFTGKIVYVVANPAAPLNITSSYTDTVKIWMAPKPLDHEPFSCSLMVWSGGRLQPLMGRDIYNLEPANSALGLGPGEYVVVVGDVKSKGIIKPIKVSKGETGWFLMDFEKNEGEFISATKKPAFFEWDPEEPAAEELTTSW